MLDQLVESNTNQKENRGAYLLTTSVLVVGLFFSAMVWSLFAKDFGVEGDLDVSTLVAPIVENAPEPIKKEQKPERANEPKTQVITRQTNMLRVDENPIVPKDVSVVPNTQKARPNGNVPISPDNLEGDGYTTNTTGRETVGGDSDVGREINEPTPMENVKKIPAPPEFKKPPVAVALKVKPPVQSLGVVNGKAKFLPKPTYTAAAKAIRAMGDVNVQVLIDEAGNVVSASAANGHPLLRGEAEKAARNAKFNPTLLSGQPVKVSGIIVYKFTM